MKKSKKNDIIEEVEEKLEDSFNARLDREYVLDETHFEVFKEEFEYWVEVYGLRGWEITYWLTEVDDQARAQCHSDQTGRVIVAVLGKTWQATEPTEYEIRRSAFHECSELFLAKINDIARSRTVTAPAIEEEIHNIIRTLENIMWEKDLAERVTK